MHDIIPHYNWLEIYNSYTDKKSPFYGVNHDEFTFRNTIYNHYIHPDWDEFGSATLYLKILYTDYEKQFSIIELIGEWNDCLYNDIMYLERNIAEHLAGYGIRYFILVGENVLNFHYSEDDYYQAWLDELEGGWIVAVNFRDHVVTEFRKAHIDHYLNFLGTIEELRWRTYTPVQLFELVKHLMTHQLNE